MQMKVYAIRLPEKAIETLEKIAMRRQMNPTTLARGFIVDALQNANTSATQGGNKSC